MPASPKKIETLKVILDSNALFVPLEFKIDIFQELESLLNRTLTLFCFHLLNMNLKCWRLRIRLRSVGKHFRFEASSKMQFVPVERKDELTTDDVIVKVAKEWNMPCFH